MTTNGKNIKSARVLARQFPAGSRLLWTCTITGVLAGVIVLWLFDLNLWSAVVFLFLIGCPLVAVWALAATREPDSTARKRP